MRNRFWQMLLEITSRYEKQPAFLYRDGNRMVSVTYPEFLQAVQKRTMYYRSIPQTRIGIWAFNSYEWIVNAAAMLLAGKVIILLDANLGEKDLLALGTYADVELLASDADMLEADQGIAASIPMQLLGQEWGSEQGDMPFEPGEEGSWICFTSGTSRSSKGVVYPMGALLCGIEKADSSLYGNTGDRYYIPVPYHHMFGFSTVFRVLNRGGIICIGQGARYLLKDLEEYQPDLAFLVPSMIKYLVQKEGFPASLRIVYTSGSALSQELYQEVRARNMAVYNQYGLSETVCPICTGTDAKEFPWMKPADGVRFVRTPEGELGVYLAFHLQEYYKKEADTLAVLDKDAHLFWTGDAAEIDDDGYILIRGRMRDTIVLENGEKIHAGDTDDELLGLPGVEDAAVIGIDGELIAVFVKSPGVSEEQIREELKLLNQRRYTFARIHKTWFVEDKLPRTAVGKLKRFILENEYRKRMVDGNETK